MNEILNEEMNFNTLRKRIKGFSDPIELHVLAALACETGKWHDIGFEFPASVANHPFCDAGTGLMLYWMECPDDIYEIGGCDDSTEEEVAFLGYLKSIELRFLDGMYETSRIKFDPKIKLTGNSRKQYRWIPFGMLNASAGKTIRIPKWERDEDYNVVIK